MKDYTALKDYELIYELLASLQTRAQAESNLKVMEANNSYNEINLEPTVTDLIYKPWLLEKLDLTSRQARALNLIRECVDRISKSKPTVGLQITSSSELGEDLRNRLKNKPQEELWGLYLNNKNVVIREECISRGTLNTSEEHPRDIYRRAIECNAARIILAHNHPSGDVSPSQQDFAMTARVKQVGELVGIELIDHLIIGGDCYYSFAEKSQLN